MRGSLASLLVVACWILSVAGFAQAQEWSEQITLEGGTAPPSQLLFAPAGDPLILVDQDGNVATRTIWDPQARPIVKLRDRKPLLVAVAPFGSHAAVWSREHGVELVDLRGETPPRALDRGNFESLRNLAFTPDEKQLIGLTDANQLIRWSVDSGEITATHDLAALAGPIALAADGSFAVGFREPEGFVVWDIDQAAVRFPLEAASGTANRLAISPDARYIAAAPASDAERIDIWDARSGHLLQKLAVPGATKTSLEFTADGQSLVVADAAGLVTVWQVASGVPFCRFEVPADAREAFAVSADAEQIAVAQSDGKIIIWPLESEFGRPPRSFAFVAESADGEAPDEEFVAEVDERVPRNGGPTANGGREPAAVDEPTAADEPDAGTEYKFVPVLFGTNRRNDAAYSWSDRFIGFFFTWLAAVVYACIILGVLLALIGRTSRVGRWIVGLGVVALLVLAAIYAQAKHSRAFDTAGDEYTAAAGPLVFGRCVVSVPPIHEPGVLETPLEIWVFRGAEQPDKHIMIQSLTPLSADEFTRQLNLELEDSPGKDAFVFIHGYNVPFRDAVRRTAQLAVDLEFPGPALCYSWPSHADPLRYLFDETNAAASAAPLRDFLRRVTATSSAERVHIIAHSMGNRVLAAALQLLNDEERRRFGCIVLAAPDIDRREFLDPIAPAIAAAQLHVTLYASSNDNALWLSKRFHDFQRAGDTVPEPTLCDGVETIDASTVDTSLLGHSYYGDRPTMIKDLATLLLQNQRAADRLPNTATELNGRTYWMILPGP